MAKFTSFVLRVSESFCFVVVHLRQFDDHGWTFHTSRIPVKKDWHSNSKQIKWSYVCRRPKFTPEAIKSSQLSYRMWRRRRKILFISKILALFRVFFGIGIELSRRMSKGQLTNLTINIFPNMLTCGQISSLLSLISIRLLNKCFSCCGWGESFKSQLLVSRVVRTSLIHTQIPQLNLPVEKDDSKVIEKSLATPRKNSLEMLSDYFHFF